ncbi:MAG: isochorismatase family protein [Anaerolineae bacterium]|nr:isochorismatase family protein [Anaerolineae bacterium]
MGESSERRLAKIEQAVTALLVIDVQQGLFEKVTPIYKGPQLLQNINTLIVSAHLSGVPVFYVQHSDQKTLVKGSPEWQLHTQLGPLNQDSIIHKQHGNAFEETALDEALRSRGVTTVVVTGLVTHGCVRATCIGARQLGYRVILVTDGHSSFSKQASKLIEEWHQKLAAIGVELYATSEIVFSLNIREATVEDSRELAHIQVDSYRRAYAGIFPQAYLDAFTYEEQEQDWCDLLTSGLQDILLVAELQSGKLVGYALGRPGFAEVLPYDSELVALHVRREFQGQGVGQKLALALARALKQRGCTSLMVWVLERNPARGFYERLGGQLLDVRKDIQEAVFEVAYGWATLESLFAERLESPSG